MYIVLEGIDGAGKSTQIAKLRDMFRAKGVESEYLHFPRFDAPVYGELIARFLRGDLGSVESVNPYLVALLYAGDRADAAKMIRGWLKEGKKVVIVDRYVYSNIGYQCAKLPRGEKRNALKDWILHTEFEEFQIPRPDLSLFLDVPLLLPRRNSRRRARVMIEPISRVRRISTRHHSICSVRCARYISMRQLKAMISRS